MKLDMPVTQVRRMEAVLDLDDDEGENPWWNDKWEKERAAPLFWERMQKPEDLLDWQHGQPNKESEDSEKAEEAEV